MKQRACLSFLAASMVLLPLGCDDTQKGSDTATAVGSAKAEAKNEAPAVAKEAEEKVEAIELSETLALGDALSGDAAKPYQGLTVKAPAGCKVESDGDQTMLMVVCGDRQYSIAVAGDGTDEIDAIRGKEKESKLSVVEAAYVDEPAAFAWSWVFKGGDPNHSFVADVKTGETTFRCTNKGFGSFDRAHNEAMLKSCQSLSK